MKKKMALLLLLWFGKHEQRCDKYLSVAFCIDEFSILINKCLRLKRLNHMIRLLIL